MKLTNREAQASINELNKLEPYVFKSVNTHWTLSQALDDLDRAAVPLQKLIKAITKQIFAGDTKLQQGDPRIQEYNDKIEDVYSQEVEVPDRKIKLSDLFDSSVKDSKGDFHPASPSVVALKTLAWLIEDDDK